MSYRCVRELTVGTNTIPMGAVIEHVGHDSHYGKACRTFAIGGVHYCIYLDAFKAHFDEVES